MPRQPSRSSPLRRRSTTPPPSPPPPPPSSPTSPTSPSTTTPPPPPPPPPSPTPERVTITSIILGNVDQPPQSWLEMGLSGHSMTFTFRMRDNQDIVLGIQDPLFMSQIVAEGMRLGLVAFDNRVDDFPEMELPFYPPEQLEVTIFEINNPPPTNNTHDTPPSQPPQIEEDTTPLPSMALQQGIRTKLYLLNSMKSFIIEEEYMKKCILMCPVRLSKCTMDVRVITNHNSKKFAVFLVPTLLPVQTDEDEDEEEPAKMSLMIWNCRGSEQSDFRRSYRSMLNYHRPNMVLLLETHMTHHQYLADEFSFTDIAHVPAVEGCGGMALVWKKDVVGVDGLAINNEEIHCTIQIQ